MKRTKFTKAIANFLVMVSMFSAIAVIPKKVEAAGEREASRSSSTTGDRNSSRFSLPNSGRGTILSPTSDRRVNFCYRVALAVLNIDFYSTGFQKTVSAALVNPNGFDAASYARGIFKSSYINIDDRTYVYQLYRALFDRTPSAPEANYWIDRINKGDSREYILECFLASDEFRTIARNLRY